MLLALLALAACAAGNALAEDSPPPEVSYVAPGQFLRGSAGEFFYAADDTVHPVVLTRAYLVTRTEVTVAEFAAFVAATGYRTTAEQAAADSLAAAAAPADSLAAEPDSAAAAPSLRPVLTWMRPGRLQGEDWPVTVVSFVDAARYANWRSREDGLAPAYRFQGQAILWDRSADGWRLPTEAEWEFAARCGGACSVPAADDPAGVGPVGRAWPNELGVTGLTDGVLEWCWDGHVPYGSLALVDPAQPARDGVRVVRGASVTGRDWAGEEFWSPALGFRLVRNAPQPADSTATVTVAPGSEVTVAELRERQRLLAGTVRQEYAVASVADSLMFVRQDARERVQRVGGGIMGLGVLTLVIGGAVAGSSATEPTQPEQPEPAAVSTGETMAVIGAVATGVGLLVYLLAADELAPEEARARARSLIQERELAGGVPAVGVALGF
jgi:formylglycine-generating enzyme required for sulfatase activity